MGFQKGRFPTEQLVQKSTLFSHFELLSKPLLASKVMRASNFRSGVVMGRQTPYRKTADVLRKTIQQLENDPTIDTKGAAFVDLKCNLLNRILELEADKARSESVIHLVDSEDPSSAKADKELDSNSAIA